MGETPDLELDSGSFLMTFQRWHFWHGLFLASPQPFEMGHFPTLHSFTSSQPQLQSAFALF